MKSQSLGLLLQDSLDAAFCGEAYYGPEKIANWGREIMDSLREGLPGQERVQEILWGLARRILQDLMTDHNGPEMLAQNPGKSTRLSSNSFLKVIRPIAGGGRRRLGPSPFPLDPTKEIFLTCRKKFVG